MYVPSSSSTKTLKQGFLLKDDENNNDNVDDDNIEKYLQCLNFKTQGHLKWIGYLNARALVVVLGMVAAMVQMYTSFCK